MARYLPAIPARLQQIDDLIRPQHFHLTKEDDCYFLWEWDGAPYADSDVTDFIGNFQKHARFRGKDPWKYKTGAMRHAANAIKANMPPSWRTSTFVPVPPCKIKGDPHHDSRLLETLSLIDPPLPEIHELVIQVLNTESRQKGVPPQTRAHNWRLECGTLQRIPDHFVVFDDLLTGGSHFVAMKLALARKFPGVPVTGLFLARRVLANLVDDSSA